MSPKLLLALVLVAGADAKATGEESVLERLQARAVGASRSLRGAMDRALADKKTVVHGPKSAPEHDASSTATCPDGSQVGACFLEQNGAENQKAGDGLVIGEDATYCAAHADYSNVSVSAQAWCFSNASLTVAVSGDDFQLGWVKASCPSGCPAIFCTCYSPWAQCVENRWQNYFQGSNTSDTCVSYPVQGVPRCPGCAGAKVYALCDCGHSIVDGAHRL